MDSIHNFKIFEMIGARDLESRLLKTFMLRPVHLSNIFVCKHVFLINFGTLNTKINFGLDI